MTTRTTGTTAVRLAAASLCLAGAALAGAAGPGHAAGLQAARRATAGFTDVATAAHAHYGLLRDAAGIACIDNPGVGAMGEHYVNQRLVGDAVVDVRTPEALVYEPRAGGSLRLGALEYIVVKSAWDRAHRAPPRLFGRRFALVTAPNRYGLPPFYELHAWAYTANPRGTFDDWNPRVSCAAA